MDTIDSNSMLLAAEHVARAGRGMPIIHTVIITLNGAHGGADVRIHGFTSDELDEPLTIEEVVR